MIAETSVVERLADTLAAFAAEPDDWRVLTARSHYSAADGELDWSGLTLGDLRALLEQYRTWRDRAQRAESEVHAVRMALALRPERPESVLRAVRHALASRP